MESKVKVSPVNMKERAELGIRAGDTVRVWQNIVELKKGKAANKKEITTKNVRRQAFEGLVLAVKHGTESGSMFTVRKVSSGVGVEKIFPLYSPMIDEVEVLRRTRTRRAKLYFIRRKAASEVKRAMRKSIRIDAPVKAVVDEVAAEEPVEEAPVAETAAE
jgi:large subunit ribosomal protein L19